ncbi:MAG: hypothetical protein NVSMB1_13780 [Polyangiales bacterium]
MGDGGLSWLAAWTLLRLSSDPLGRPALWIDTHCTLTPGDLLDVTFPSATSAGHATSAGDLAERGRLVIVRPADPHEAHIAADIALRTGSFSLIALEMHPALHPTPLARLRRLAAARVGSDARTPLVVWGEPPAFVAPPSGVPRTSFADALCALFEGASIHAARAARNEGSPAHSRSPHTTDRLRPLDRAADRRPSPPLPRASRYPLVNATTPLLPITPPILRRSTVPPLSASAKTPQGGSCLVPSPSRFAKDCCATSTFGSSAK